MPPAAASFRPASAGCQRLSPQRPRGLLEPCAWTTGPHGSEGAPVFAQSSRELKDPQQELRGLHALWVVLALGFAGTGSVVLGAGLQELACDGRVLDGGGVVDPGYGGEVEGVGTAGEGFLELPVDAEPFEGGGEAAAVLGQPVLA